MDIEYSEISRDEIFLIENLWIRLNRLHSEISPFFAEEYARKKFSDRKDELLKKGDAGILKIMIAKDKETRVIAGYCICSVIQETGEIDSIFVEETWRKHNIGNEFLKKADEFFRLKAVKKQILSVYAGNENVIPFYEKHDYYPKYIILEKRTSSHENSLTYY